MIRKKGREYGRARIKCSASRSHHRMLPETWLKEREGNIARRLGSSQEELKDLGLVYGIDHDQISHVNCTLD